MSRREEIVRECASVILDDWFMPRHDSIREEAKLVIARGVIQRFESLALPPVETSELALPAQAGPHDELVKRLRDDSRHDGHNSDRFVEHCKRVHEAASVITQQAAEIERLKDALNDVFNPEFGSHWQLVAERDDHKRKLEDAVKAAAEWRVLAEGEQP